MDFDFEKLAADERYKLLTSTVVPRPIAWITTVSAGGVRNAAPFSFFNAMGKDPPLVAVGIQGNDDGSMKDTARNILETGEFVVNLVTEADAAAMSATSVAAPADVDELELGDIATVPSLKVRPPRIASSPVAFECRLHTPLEFASGQVLIVGQVLDLFIADGHVLDAEKHYVNIDTLRPVGRMHGRGFYTRTNDIFQIDRPGPYAAAIRKRDGA